MEFKAYVKVEGVKAVGYINVFQIQPAVGLVQWSSGMTQPSQGPISIVGV